MRSVSRGNNPIHVGCVRACERPSAGPSTRVVPGAGSAVRLSTWCGSALRQAFYPSPWSASASRGRLIFGAALLYGDGAITPAGTSSSPAFTPRGPPQRMRCRARETRSADSVHRRSLARRSPLFAVRMAHHETPHRSERARLVEAEHRQNHNEVFRATAC